MWEAIVAIVGLLAAGVGYWLKRAADKAPEKLVAAEVDIDNLKTALKRCEKRRSLLQLVNQRLTRDLIELRRKTVANMPASDAVDFLRKPGEAGDPPSSAE